jgi:hypothetical protein
MPDTRYMPILKGKLGEFGALESMAATDKAAIVPLIEIPPVPWDHAANLPAKTIDQHLSKIDSKLERSWASEQPFLIDFLWIGDKERMLDGTHPLTKLFNTLRLRNLQAVPVTGLLRTDAYQDACRDIVSADKRGVALRLLPDDFEESELVDVCITKVLDGLQVQPADIDLILDLGSLRLDSGAEKAIDVISLVTAIPCIKKWRSFVLAGTGFPVDLVGIPPSQISSISRLEWTLWQDIIADSRMPRLPTFGDYAIAHPQPPEVDPRVMRASASIRYTTAGDWLVLKGKGLRNYGFQQFHDLSKSLLKSPEYSGAEFSWGDQYIEDCASRNVSCGNLTTWRKVGTSHHIALVIEQIASLVSP